jgi:predicted amidohydrolase
MPTFMERQFWGMGDADDIVVVDTDIGRISGLICGEHLMTPLRAALIAKGADIHVSVFPGSFSLTQGPRLQEAATAETNDFWGYYTARSHALEGGCFVLLAVGIQDPADIDPSFPYAGNMNIEWANGGSAIISPLAVPLPDCDRTFGQTILYGVLPAAYIKATKSIVDTVGHYSRPDILRIQINDEKKGWTTVPADPVEVFK